MTARVLVIDASASPRPVFRVPLAAAGYDVFEANDGQSAVEAAGRIRPDIVVIALEADPAAASAALQMLRDGEGTGEIPVIVVTSELTEEDLDDASLGRAHDFLRAPVQAAELVARVRAAVKTRRLADELATIVRTDQLTGLPNRYHLEEHMAMLASAARRQRRAIGVLLVDLDRFKRVNDDEGHAAGDIVLVAIARRIERALRAEDTAGRWGGEEFLVVAPATDSEGAWRLGERIRTAVQDKPVDLGDGRQIVVTVSVGAAAASGDDTDDQVRRAEHALIEAKDTGRNKVVLAADV